jgi:hypothetical protein
MEPNGAVRRWSKIAHYGAAWSRIKQYGAAYGADRSSRVEENTEGWGGAKRSGMWR